MYSSSSASLSGGTTPSRRGHEAKQRLQSSAGTPFCTALLARFFKARVAAATNRRHVWGTTKTRNPDQLGECAGQWRGLPVAIKTVVFQSTASDEQLTHIASEAAISSSLTHPNIVSTYSHDIRHVKADGSSELGIFKFHLIQEFCSGGSLRDAIDRGTFRKVPSRWRVVLSVLLDIAAGMAYMHSHRICHSDLNPANVLLKVRPSSRTLWKFSRTVTASPTVTRPTCCCKFASEGACHAGIGAHR